MLLDHGADVSVHYERERAIKAATDRGYEGIVKILNEAAENASKERPDGYGSTAFLLAET